MAKTLYLCYFGVREPLVQTQVLPYLRELRKGNFNAKTQSGKDAKVFIENDPGTSEESSIIKLEISLLTFEPNRRDEDIAEFQKVRASLAAEGIEWEWLPYHKRFSVVATAWDIFRGAWFVRQKLSLDEIDVLHGRVHVPTLMGALGRKFSRRKPKLLFDIRGFFPEEYTDAGVWPEGGWLYRSAKRVERWLMKESDGFVVLTEKAREILFPALSTTPSANHPADEASAPLLKPGGELSSAIRDPQSIRPVEVIPCCVDLKRFASVTDEVRAEMRRELGIGERTAIIYVGSFGGWYMTDEMMDLFAAARERDPSVFVIILTQRDKEKAAERLRAKGFADGDYFVGSASPADVPRYLSAADISLSFIEACYSKQSSSPTKLAEYLACGLPIICNPGVGDVDALIIDNHVGVLVDGFSKESYLKALQEIDDLGDVRERCRETAAREFDLETVGGAKYRLLYNKLLGRA